MVCVTDTDKRQMIESAAVRISTHVKIGADAQSPL
jgi:hypothetical protein